ncbi:alpha/beta fold hydrolase [Amycolatopsis pigmentata]|uniref:Alpha/beta fold hydrolase n=1 Tax=Amycolatopsis pigmentata TaxID=450801 RepID=A0ABW5G4M9_9PSEU
MTASESPKNDPLIDPPTRSMTLTDARKVTWQEFGLPDGRPVLYFHGGGSTSLEAGLFHREAVRRNLRLIAPNRPGAGGSTLCSGRTVAAYSDDLSELLDSLRIEQFACFGESNGGLITLAVAASMSARVLGAVPINPTVPWFDPLARRVCSRSAAAGYRLIKYLPWVITRLEKNSVPRIRKLKSAPRHHNDGFNPLDLAGPPPGIEQDVGEFHWRVMAERAGTPAMMAEMKWAAADWGFDYYSIPVALDIFCGAYDSQAPFALVLADRNPDARFHYFSFGHYGFSHPDARYRILDTISGYFQP